MLKRKISVSIEGLIGSGKSTLLNKLRSLNNDDKKIFLGEPIQDFQSCTMLNKEFNPLKEFYNDERRNATAFQFWVNKCFDKQLLDLSKVTTTDSTIVFDRSMYSSVVFIKTLNRKKIFSDFTENFLENEVLSTVKNYFGGEEKFGIDKLYFLNTPIHTCIEQISKRDRYEENDIRDLERYLMILDVEYKLFVYDFIQKKGIDKVRIFYHPNMDIVVKDFENFMKDN